MPAQYDLNLNKNTTFNTWIQYLEDDNTPVDLSSYNATFKIERYKEATYPLVLASTFGVTYGYTGPDSSGIPAANGSIQLNKNYTGSTINGGILINFDEPTTNSLPVGKQFYSLKLSTGSVFSEIVLEGRINVNPA